MGLSLSSFRFLFLPHQCNFLRYTLLNLLSMWTYTQWRLNLVWSDWLWDGPCLCNQGTEKRKSGLTTLTEIAAFEVSSNVLLEPLSPILVLAALTAVIQKNSLQEKAVTESEKAWDNDVDLSSAFHGSGFCPCFLLREMDSVTWSYNKVLPDISRGPVVTQMNCKHKWCCNFFPFVIHKRVVL